MRGSEGNALWEKEQRSTDPKLSGKGERERRGGKEKEMELCQSLIKKGLLGMERNLEPICGQWRGGQMFTKTM